MPCTPETLIEISLCTNCGMPKKQHAARKQDPLGKRCLFQPTYFRRLTYEQLNAMYVDDFSRRRYDKGMQREYWEEWNEASVYSVKRYDQALNSAAYCFNITQHLRNQPCITVRIDFEKFTGAKSYIPWVLKRDSAKRCD